MTMYQSIGTASDRVMATLISELEIEFGSGAGHALAKRFLEVEEVDFRWDARIEERWIGAYESHEGDQDEVDRIAICGRLDGQIKRGFSDEHRDRHYVMIDGVDGRVHYVDIGRSDSAPSVPEGATVRIDPRVAFVTQVDHTIDAVARANDGRYSIDAHLRHDPQASEAFAATHVRRLEAMRRAGASVERHDDGGWAISESHIAEADAFEQRDLRRRPVTIQLLSRSPVTELANADASTWLDRELSDGNPTAVRDVGFGREARAAMAARRQWLIEQNLGVVEAGVLRLRADALTRLSQREIERAGEQLARELGKAYSPARPGDRIEGVLARRVDLESGSQALVERSKDLTLVPWRDVLERRVGKTAAGIMRPDGINWRFDRGRSGPTR